MTEPTTIETQAAVPLTATQLATLNSLAARQEYPRAYRYLANIVTHTPDADPHIANWLRVAARINANDGSFYSDFVRYATQEAGHDNGNPISGDRFQQVSDELAQLVIGHVDEVGGLPHLDDIIEFDVRTAVDDLELSMEGWAGTLFAWAPQWLGGLGLSFDGDFYQKLIDDLKDREVDTPLEWATVITDVVENNLIGVFSSVPVLSDAGEWLGGWLYRTFNDQDPAAAFEVAEHTTSPIVLDLDGDGIETLSKEQGIHFDLDNNGMAETVGWVGANDGLLVRDINGNGTIDSGAELMGNHTLLENGDKAANGYEALAELDSNGDGIISSDDTAFNELNVWLDKNSDGISQQDELISLADAGIASLNTAYQEGDEDDGHGNITKQTSTATRDDGTVIDTADIWFGVNLTQTVDRNKIALSEELLALPEAYAFGNVRSLRQTMVNDAVLTELVTQFTQATHDSDRLSLVNSIIYQWAGTADIDPNSRDQTQYYRHVIDARQLVTLENLVGRDYLGTWCGGRRDANPHGNAAPKLRAEYQRFKSYVTAQLLSQTVYKALFSELSVSYNSENQTVEPDLTALTTTLKTQLSSGEIGNGFVIGALQVLSGLASYSTSLQHHYQTIKDDAVLGQYTVDNWIIGTASNDNLVGGNQDDTIQGLAGDDHLAGGTGSDSYVWGWGDGNDSINDYDRSDRYNSDHQDTLIFGAGITASDINWSRNGNHLVATLTDETGTDQILSINNWFSGSQYQIEQLQLSDGNVLDKTEIEAAASIIRGTEGNDTLYAFSDTDNTLLGLAGSDTLYGNNGADRLEGGADNDWLYGRSGDDQLTGGSGDDQLSGGTGSDIYHWGWGDGNDSINDYDRSDSRNSDHQDTLIFGAGITASDISWSRKNSHLVATLTDEAGTDQTLTLNNWFSGEHYQVEQLQLADGTLLDKTEIAAAAHIIVGTEAHDTLYAFSNKDNTLLGLAGSDKLYGNNGADRLEGGAGNDNLYARSGDDVLIGGTGDDTLRGEAGSDTYIWGWGDGNDSISDYDYYDMRNNDHQDTLIFGSGITASDINWSRKNSHLVATLTDEAGTDQTLTLNNWFSGEHYQVEQLQLADGTVLNKTEIAAAAHIIVGTEAHDTLYAFSNKDNTLLGLAGSDKLYGNNGADRLEGGAGNDNLYARSGDDVLIGGTGDDILRGEAGSDTYIWGWDDGNDSISDYDYYDMRNNDHQDTLIFGSGITASDINWSRKNSHLVATLTDEAGTEQTLTINNWFSGDSYQVEQLQLADGTVLDKTEIESAVTIQGSDTSDYVYGFNNSDDKLLGLAGNDRLYARSGDDQLTGGSGNDWLQGDSGDDSYHFSTDHGSDTIYDTARQSYDSLVYDNSFDHQKLTIEQQQNHLKIGFLGDANNSVTLRNGVQQVNLNAWRLQVGSYLLNEQQLKNYAKLSNNFAAPDKQFYSEEEKQQLANFWTQLA